MREKLPYLTEDEKKRYEMCLRNIEDKLKALKIETENERPYRYYIKEKIDSILWDAKVIEQLTHTEIEED